MKSAFHKPAKEGIIVYLNANPNMSLILDLIKATGCPVLMPKTQINLETGYMAIFLDTEENKIGLHS